MTVEEALALYVKKHPFIEGIWEAFDPDWRQVATIHRTPGGGKGIIYQRGFMNKWSRVPDGSELYEAILFQAILFGEYRS